MKKAMLKILKDDGSLYESYPFSFDSTLKELIKHIKLHDSRLIFIKKHSLSSLENIKLKKSIQAKTGIPTKDLSYIYNFIDVENYKLISNLNLF